MIDPNAATEAHYDRLDDQGELSASEARQISGLETDGSSDDFSAEAIMARNPEFAFDSTIGGIHDPRNQRAWAESNTNPDQKRRNDNGVRAARLAMHPPQAS